MEEDSFLNLIKIKRSKGMFRQGRFMIFIGTMVLVIAGWFFPFNLWQKLFFSIAMIGIGMLAYGSSVLFDRLAKKFTNRGE